MTPWLRLGLFLMCAAGQRINATEETLDAASLSLHVINTGPGCCIVSRTKLAWNDPSGRGIHSEEGGERWDGEEMVR